MIDINDPNSLVNDAVRKAVRHFSGRIAHDFNNMLTVQLAYPDIIRQYLPENSKGIEFLKVMEDNAELMTSVVSRLAHFALPADYAKKPVCVDDLIREIVIDFNDDPLALGIRIKLELNSESDVLIPHDVFCMIVREICANSFESMNGSGTLTIKTTVMNVDEPMVVSSCAVPLGKYVSVSVSDSGGGINADIRKKVFEPFFTTNKQSKARGAGLGLSIAFSEVRDCGGFLLLGESADECEVSIILPLDIVEGDLETELVSDISENGDLSRVLVVDDEEEITKLFKIMLISAIENIRVDIAHNGAEAIALFKKHKHAVVVMDLHMPVVDGQEAFGKLEQLCSENGIKMPGVVFCTGYIPPEGIKKAVSTETSHSLLKKPVSIKALTDAVKERLPV